MGDVVLVRHGETEWSRGGRHTSHTDVPLTPDGERQADLLGDRLRDQTFTRVLSSPLQRAMATCERAGFAAVVETRSELTEWDYGAYEGRTTADIRTERPGWDLWVDDAPEGETAEDVARRVDPLVQELQDLEHITLVFSHGHLLRVLAARWVGLDPRKGRHLGTLATGSLSRLGWEREAPAISTWNS